MTLKQWYGLVRKDRSYLPTFAQLNKAQMKSLLVEYTKHQNFVRRIESHTEGVAGIVYARRIA